MQRSIITFLLAVFLLASSNKAFAYIPAHAWDQLATREVQACRLAAPTIDVEAVRAAIQTGHDIGPLINPRVDALNACYDKIQDELPAAYEAVRQGENVMNRARLDALSTENLILTSQIMKLESLEVSIGFARIFEDMSPRACLKKVPKLDKQALEEATREGEGIAPLIDPTREGLDECERLARIDLEIWESIANTHPAMEVQSLREEIEDARNKAFTRLFVIGLAKSELDYVMTSYNLAQIRGSTN